MKKHYTFFVVYKETIDDISDRIFSSKKEAEKYLKEYVTLFTREKRIQDRIILKYKIYKMTGEIK